MPKMTRRQVKAWHVLNPDVREQIELARTRQISTGVASSPLVKRVHISGLVLEASIREKRRSKAVLRRYREGKQP